MTAKQNNVEYAAPHNCVWSETFDGPWATDCGHLFGFVDDGPRENGTRFCQYCGGNVQPVSVDDAFMEDGDDE